MLANHARDLTPAPGSKDVPITTPISVKLDDDVRGLTPAAAADLLKVLARLCVYSPLAWEETDSCPAAVPAKGRDRGRRLSRGHVQSGPSKPDCGLHASNGAQVRYEVLRDRRDHGSAGESHLVSAAGAVVS